MAGAAAAMFEWTITRAFSRLLYSLGNSVPSRRKFPICTDGLPQHHHQGSREQPGSQIALMKWHQQMGRLADYGNDSIHFPAENVLNYGRMLPE